MAFKRCACGAVSIVNGKCVACDQKEIQRKLATVPMFSFLKG